MPAVTCASDVFGEVSASRALELAAQAGFKSVELNESHAREVADGIGFSDSSPNVFAVAFGDTDCGDVNVLVAHRGLAAAVGAQLATVRAMAPNRKDPESWLAAAEATRDGLFASEGAIALELPVDGSLVPDAATYSAFWPLTVHGRAPLAIDIAAAIAADINPNQLWRTLASRIALLHVDTTLITDAALSPWLRGAITYAYPGSWVLRSSEPEPAPLSLGEARLELIARVEVAGRGRRP